MMAAVFAVLFVRLAHLQIVRGRYYASKAARHRVRERPSDAFRGGIVDRNGTVLAVDRHVFDVCVLFKLLCSPDDWVGRLSRVSEVPVEDVRRTAGDIMNRVGKIWHAAAERHVERGLNPRYFRVREEYQTHPVIKDVPFDVVARLEAQHERYPGCKVTARAKRVYPLGMCASNVVGYMALAEKTDLDRSGGDFGKRLTDKDMVGRSGMEGRFDEWLRGSRGRWMEDRIRKEEYEVPPEAGADVALTIDARIQQCGEEALGESEGSIVVMDPHSGEVLALATSPRFDPNTFRKDYPDLDAHPGKPLLNRPIQSLIPAGSVFKPVTTVAALAEGKIDATTRFTCHGSVRAHGIRFRCAATRGHGSMSLVPAIEHSCNVYFYECAKLVGGKALREWSFRFGFGKRTGISISHENRGRVPEANSLPALLNMCIGQGKLLVTPIQVVRMMAVIANGGFLVRPVMVKALTNEHGELLPNPDQPARVRLPISDEHLALIRRGLRLVTISGTASAAGLDYLEVAGKTGTAETNRDENHLWFAGYAPWDAPRYVFVVVLENQFGHAGDVAGPVAADVVRGIYEIESAPQPESGETNMVTAAPTDPGVEG